MSYSASYSTGGSSGGGNWIDQFVRDNDARVAANEKAKRDAAYQADQQKIWRAQELGHAANADAAERAGNWTGAATSWNGAKTAAYRLGAYDRQGQYDQREQNAKMRAGQTGGPRATISSALVGRTLAQRQAAMAMTTPEQQQQAVGGGMSAGTLAVGAAVLAGAGWAIWKFVL